MATVNVEVNTFAIIQLIDKLLNLRDGDSVTLVPFDTSVRITYNSKSNSDETVIQIYKRTREELELEKYENGELWLS